MNIKKDTIAPRYFRVRVKALMPCYNMCVCVCVCVREREREREKYVVLPNDPCPWKKALQCYIFSMLNYMLQ